jgi:tRNA(Ile)-lysidine synthase
LTHNEPRAAAGVAQAIVDRADALLRRYGAFVNGQTVVAGCSGGADSCVLVHVLKALGAEPRVVHVNYGLRGEDSEADEAFVVAMCRRLDLEPVVIRVAEPDIRDGATTSVQDTARRIRYGAFKSQATTSNAKFVAVAHTLNDQSETVLLHLLRGTGIDGLAGMRVQRELARDSGIRLIRPLLTTSRDEVEAVALELGLEWRTDLSNVSDAYARGRLRSGVVPAIEEAFGRSQWLNIGRVALHIGGYVDDDVAVEVEDRFKRIADSGLQRLSIGRLLDESPSWRGRILLEAIRRWAPSMPASADWVARIEALADAQPGKRLQSGSAAVVRDREFLAFVAEAPLPCTEPLSVDTSVPCGSDHIHLYELAFPPVRRDPGSADLAFVDGSVLAAPITVRVWRAGDRMTPLGMHNSKLVSDILTDRKVPASRRGRVPLVLSGEEVVWCAGVAVSDRFKVTDKSERALLLIRTPDVSGFA